jgi:hypothetical protein
VCDCEVKARYKEAFLKNNGFPCEIQDCGDGLGYIIIFKNNKSRTLSANELMGFTESLMAGSKII